MAGGVFAGRLAELTPRESEVLRLVAQGRSNRQIGETLFISAQTAGVHVSDILMKLESYLPNRRRRSRPSP